MIDQAKIRREGMRWYLLLTLYNAQPVGCYEELLLQTLQALYQDATQMDIRKQLDYLEERCLLEVHREPDGRWFAKLIRYGIDLVEYTIDCEPGIARPVKS
ncbi:hypothetical protein [Pseudoduganella sp. RAF53_2]|uniref:hypothetical protein n=1 Tax=unclassified Pseudoduganella TaxID=2637179 RepID=UPI003F954CA6